MAQLKQARRDFYFERAESARTGRDGKFQALAGEGTDNQAQTRCWTQNKASQPCVDLMENSCYRGNNENERLAA